MLTGPTGKHYGYQMDHNEFDVRFEEKFAQVDSGSSLAFDVDKAMSNISQLRMNETEIKLLIVGTIMALCRMMWLGSILGRIRGMCV